MATALQKDYVQFSKKVTRWGMTLMTVTLMSCLAIIAFCRLDSYAVNAIVSLYTAFSAVLGVIVGTYQGNSTLEKYTRARYNYRELFDVSTPDSQVENESSNG